MKQTKGLKVERVKIGDLRLHPHNARQGDVGAICQSLEAHGQYRPLVVQRSTGNVVAGNHTLQAAQALGWTEVDVTYLDVDDDQALRILLVDNRANDLATYDDSVLTDLLEALVRTEYGLAGTGFTGDDLDQMIADQLEDRTAAEVVEDDAPSIPSKAKTEAGNVWLLGQHRLICGDSTLGETYKALLGLDKADLVVTDPPYNVAYQDNMTPEEAAKWRRRTDGLIVANDNMSEDDFRSFLLAVYSAISDAMVPGAPAYVFHPPGGDGDTFRATFRESGFELKQMLIWVKQRFVLGRQDYNYQHEPIIYGWKSGAAHRWYGNFNKSTVLDDDLDPEEMKKSDLVQLILDLRQASSVIREDRPARNGEHPTMKPVRLIARLVENSSKPGDVVLDPFGGSGSTLMACQQMNRQARLIELDPKYCDVIARRFEQATGITPVLEATGKAETFLD